MSRKSKIKAIKNTPYSASGELYQALFEQAADGIFIADEQGDYFEVNRHGCEMLGYTREEILNLSLQDLILADDLAHDPLQLDELRAGKTLLKERHLRCKDGRLLLVEISARMLTDGSFLAMVRDISKRRQAEEQLRESNERFRLLAESSLTGIYLIQENRFRYVNPALAHIFGYEVEEVIDKLGPMDLVYPDHRILVAENLRRRIEGEVETIHYDFRGLHKDGSLIYVEVHGRRIEYGGKTGVIGTLVDITQRKQTEEALRTSEERLQLALDAAQMGLWHWNIITGEVIWSQKCLALYGLPPDTQISYERFLQALHPEDRERIDAALRRAVDDRTGYDEQKRTIWPDGSIHWTASRGQVYCDDAGQPIRMTGVTFDITKRKEVEEALRKSHEELRVFFSQTIDGCFFMMLDKPVRWDETIDKEEVLDYVFAHQRITKINDAMLAQYGATREQMLELTPHDFFQHNLAHGRDLWRQLFDTGKVRLESDERKLDGTAMWIEGEYILLYDGQGRITGHFGIQRDISKRKQAEKALRQQTRLVEALFTKAVTPFVLLDRDCKFIRVNEAYANHFQMSAEDFPGLSYLDFMPGDETYRSNTIQIVDEVVRSGKPFRLSARPFELPNQPERNVTYWDRVLQPIFDERGELDFLYFSSIEVTERVQAEAERLAHLRFLESLDQVNRAMQGTNDLEQMMSDVLDVVLTIFDCDRAWLIYPCDPKATSWQSLLERTRPEYPGALTLRIAVPMDPDVASVFQTVREASGPVKFGPGSKHPLPADVKKQFNIQSQMAMAIYPKTDKPWMFGLHQCSYPRVWTAQEVRLFQEIGWRLADVLTGLLAYRNLHQSEHRLAEAERIAHVGWWDRDYDADSITLSDEACRIFGLPLEEQYAYSLAQWHKRWQELIHPEDQPEMTRAAETALQGGPRYDVEYRVVRPNGQVRFVRSQGDVTWDELGRPRRMFGIMQDITERKQAEMEREQLLAQIQEQAHQVRNIIDTVPEGVILLDKDQFVTLTNPVARQYLALLVPDWGNGYLTHLGNRPLYELLTSPPKGLWHEIISGNVVFEAIARPVENSSHNGGWVLVLREITQERDIQRQVQRQERLAAVGQLAAGIAHDFNNILAIIILYAQYISRTVALSPQTRERLHTIEQQGQRATDLVQQILDFSRQSILERQPFDLLPFLDKLVTLLERTLPEHIQIELEHTADAYFIHADPSRMQQVLMNLAVNARDAMPEGGRLQIRVAHVQTETSKPMPVQDLPPGNWVQIEVTDSGDGIPSEALSHIFEPFFTTKRVGEGTGLGLAQVYGIVQQHDGYIDVITEPGQGTSFFLYFPALNTEENAADMRAGAVLQLGQKQKILLVEDDPATRKALLDSLTLMNYEVIEASNGREALTILATKATEIELVLSDAVMPVMGGIALYHAMREQNLNIPVVLLTGHPLSKEMEDLQALGLAGWLPKPPDLVNLSYLLAEALTG